MDILNRLFGQKPQITQRYRVEDGRLSVEASTLKNAYASSERSTSAGKMLEHATTAKALAARDGQADDVDTRLGHVVLPQERFEFHDGVSTFTTFEDRPGGGTTECLDSVTQNGDTIEVNRSYAHANNRATKASLNPEEGTLTVTRDALPVENAWGGTGRWSKLEKSKFELGADGYPVLDDAKSLEGYEEDATARARAERARELIDAASLWQAEGLRLDGQGVDLNPAGGETVAPGLSRESLAHVLTQENVLAPLVYGSGEIRSNEPSKPSQHFGVELRPDGFVVDASGRYASSSRLTGSSDGSTTTIMFEDRNDAESVTISQRDGTVTYQIYEPSLF